MDLRGTLSELNLTKSSQLYEESIVMVYECLAQNHSHMGLVVENK